MSDGKKMAGALDWKSVATWQHLFAATMAAHDLKLKYNEIARYMSLDGPPTTYDAVEGRFRKIRKEAEKLQARSNELPAIAARGGGGKKKASTAPRNSQASSNGSQGVISGRIKKSTPAKPKKIVQDPENIFDALEPELDTDYGTASMDQDHSTSGFDISDFNYTAELNAYDDPTNSISDEGYGTYGHVDIKQEL